MGTHLDLVFVSDTHELHREVDVPPGDILIAAGDFTMFSRRLSAIQDFNAWLGELPHRHKVVCPGNHEFFLERSRKGRVLLTNATVLIDEGIELAGLRVWASPVTPQAGGAFAIASAEARAEHWAKVPEVDLLVTHGPPYGTLDRSPGQGAHQGDPELLAALRRIQPIIHIFGHVHGASGQATIGGTHFVNAALLGVEGGIVGAPPALRLPGREATSGSRLSQGGAVDQHGERTAGSGSARTKSRGRC